MSEGALVWVQLALHLGAIATMCAGIALFLAIRGRIQSYAARGFDGSKLFRGYAALLALFLAGYVVCFVLWLRDGMTYSYAGFLMANILFFGAWFVVLTMRFVRRLFDSIVLERKNQTDSLTGLLNKGAVGLAIEEELHKATDCSFLICDLDNFKVLNDTFGHVAGDTALVEVAQVIVSTLRDDDIVGRFGGDEFVALLVGAGTDEAARAAERIRERVTAYFDEAYPEAHAGLSVGIAGRRAGSTVGYGQLFTRADRALYKSKERGKGAACVWTEDMGRRS